MRQAGKALGQLAGWHIRHAREVGGVRQAAHLLACRLGQRLVAVANIYIPQASHAVQNFAAFRGVQIHAIGALHHHCIGMRGWMLQRMQLMRVKLLQDTF